MFMEVEEFVMLLPRSLNMDMKNKRNCVILENLIVFTIPRHLTIWYGWQEMFFFTFKLKIEIILKRFVRIEWLTIRIVRDKFFEAWKSQSRNNFLEHSRRLSHVWQEDVERFYPTSIAEGDLKLFWFFLSKESKVRKKLITAWTSTNIKYQGLIFLQF